MNTAISKEERFVALVFSLSLVEAMSIAASSISAACSDFSLCLRSPSSLIADSMSEISISPQQRASG